jgi:hypothetical protein
LDDIHSALAQLVEQLTVNQWVAGSSPAGGANTEKALKCMHFEAFFYLENSRCPTPLTHLQSQLTGPTGYSHVTGVVNPAVLLSITYI